METINMKDLGAEAKTLILSAESGPVRYTTTGFGGGCSIAHFAAALRYGLLEETHTDGKRWLVLTPKGRDHIPAIKEALEQRKQSLIAASELRDARQKLGLTLDQMAAMLGYNGEHMRSQLHRMETGERPVREAQRRLIDAYLAGYRPSDWPGQD